MADKALYKYYSALVNDCYKMKCNNILRFQINAFKFVKQTNFIEYM